MKLNNSSQLKPNEKNVEANEKRVAPDGGFGWAVVFAAFFIHFISSGIVYSFGIIYTQFLDEFKESKAYTSWILSLMTGLGSVSGPIVAFLVKKYGCRTVEIAAALVSCVSFFASSFATNVFTLIITIGIGSGVGNALHILPAVICVTTYFEKNRALATGVAVAGTGLGTFAMAPFISFLIAEYGWRRTMMVLSGIFLLCGLLGTLFKPLKPLNLSTQEKSKPEKIDTLQRKQSKSFDFKQNDHLKKSNISSTNSNNDSNICKNFVRVLNLDLLTDPIFILFTFSSFMICLGYCVPFFCIGDKALALNMTKENVSNFISIIGITNTSGRLILGYISDKPWINRLYVYIICLTICGTATALSFLCYDYKTFIIYSAIFGLSCSSFVTLQSVILTDLLGLDKFESAFGLLLFFRGTSTFIGSPLIGYLHDQTKSYTPGFIFAGSSIAFGGLVLLAMLPLQKYVLRRKLQHKNDHIESKVAS